MDYKKMYLKHDAPNSNEEMNYAWGWKRIVAAVATGGVSEVGKEIQNHGASNGTVGGVSWTVAEANKYTRTAAPKVETILRVTNAIIGTDPANVKQNRANDWATLLAAANSTKVSVLERWTLLQAAMAKGWGDKVNITEAKWQFQHIYDMEQWANKADNQRHTWSTVRDIDKAVQVFKTANLAAGRIPFLMLIKVNAFGIASSMASQRRNDNAGYEKVKLFWKQIGGNRTDFDNAVSKGAKKKSFPSKKNTSAEGRNFASTPADETKTPDGEVKVTPKGADTLNGVLKAAPAGVAGILQVLINTPVTVWGTAGVAAGSVVGGLVISKIQAKPDPKGGSDFGDAKSDYDASDAANLKNTDADAKMMPPWAKNTLYGVGGLALAGGIYFGIKAISKSKKN